MSTTQSKIIKAASEYFSKQSNVLFAYLFGSHANNTATPQSDIDIAVYVNHEEYSSEKKLDLLHTLSLALNSDAADLVILNQAPITLAIRVLEKHIILIDRDPLMRHRFESLTMRKYFDFSYIEKEILERRFLNG